MRCYFVRHGQSANNLLYETTGSNIGRSDDPILTPLGEIQARRVAKFLCEGCDPGDGAKAEKGFAITHVYSSLMRRALSTGMEISRVVGVPLMTWIDLHEQGGIYLDDPQTGDAIGQSGLQWQELTALYPNLIIRDELEPDGWWNRPRETREEAYQRGKKVILELQKRHGNTDDRVVIVSHAAFYNCFIGALLGLDTRDGYWFSLNNTGLTRIDFEKDYINLIYHNQVCFLDLDQIT